MEAGNHLFLFFADGLDAFVGFAQLDVAHSVQNPHHLFLVDHHSVGLFQYSIDGWMHFARRFATVFYIHVLHHHSAFQRTRAIEC